MGVFALGFIEFDINKEEVKIRNVLPVGCLQTFMVHLLSLRD